MSPATGWLESDYYAAVRNARAGFERTFHCYDPEAAYVRMMAEDCALDERQESRNVAGPMLPEGATVASPRSGVLPFVERDGVLEEVESSALPTGAAAAGSISSSASLTAVPHASPNSRHDALDLGAASQRLDTPWGAPFGNGGVREAAP